MNNSTVSGLNAAKRYKKKSQLISIWQRFRRNKAALLGLFIFTFIVLMALGAPILFDYETDVIEQHVDQRLQPPSSEHLFGLDEMGRDVLARVVYGARVSLMLGLSAIAISLIIGGILGAIAGYFGGLVDNIIMRCVDVIMAIPAILLAIVIVAALGTSNINLIFALSISNISTFARTVRSCVLTVRDAEFIEASKAIGARHFTIITSHILPNSIAPVLVSAAVNTAFVILNISALSFLGLGVKPPQPEWGAMLSTGRTFIRDSSYLTFFPGLAIMLTILSLNLLSDGLRDALDPKLK